MTKAITKPSPNLNHNPEGVGYVKR